MNGGHAHARPCKRAWLPKVHQKGAVYPPPQYLDQSLPDHHPLYLFRTECFVELCQGWSMMFPLLHHTLDQRFFRSQLERLIVSSTCSVSSCIFRATVSLYSSAHSTVVVLLCSFDMVREKRKDDTVSHESSMVERRARPWRKPHSASHRPLSAIVGCHCGGVVSVF